MDALVIGWMEGWMDGVAGWVNQGVDGWTDQLMGKDLICWLIDGFGGLDGWWQTWRAGW